MQSLKRILSGIIGLVVLLGIVWLTTQMPASPAPGSPVAQATNSPAAAPASRATATPRLVTDGLPAIAVDRLPPEAWDTIALIDRGGPFPYQKDGATFGNRERLLPRQPSGYYREYTIITPGSADRGARRIVAGDAGELYYTDDHYASFRRVVR
ncbi:MAG: hypothetical protein H0T53_02050 [Herpetosiphonaceae bacterium]|nr:hypothetical protein [Herpetosiphonaceae bacterium]